MKITKKAMYIKIVCYRNVSSILFYLVEPGIACSVYSTLVSPAPRCIQRGGLRLVDLLTMLKGCQWRAGKWRMDFAEGKSVVGEGVAEVRRGELGVTGRQKIAQAIWQFHPPARCLGFDTVSTPCTAICAISWCHHGEKN